MPGTSVAQVMAARADLRRIRMGKKPRTFKSMSAKDLRDFAKTDTKGLPSRASTGGIAHRGLPPGHAKMLKAGFARRK